MKKCDKCGQESEEMGENTTCAKCMKASDEIVASAGDELKDALGMLDKVTQAKGELQQAYDSVVSELTEVKEKNTKYLASLEQANSKIYDMTASLRKSALGVNDEDWEKKKEVILKMDDASFNMMIASISEVKKMQVAGVRLPEPVAGGTHTKEPISLR